MVRLLYFVSALSLACCLQAAPWLPSAAAQIEGTRHERARDLFKQGIALAKSERWTEALSAFRDSAELFPRPSTSYNIANALYRLDRPLEGLVELDEYQGMSEVLIDAAARERGAKLRKLLEGAVVEIRLAITPAGADVFVDEQPFAYAGPDRAIRLDPGNHAIRISHAGYQTAVREIQAEPGSQHAQTIALEPHTRSSRRAAGAPAPSIAFEPDQPSAGTTRNGEDDRKRFVKRPGFWVLIGVIAAAGIGAGVAVALTRKDDGTSCGTTGTCATTQGLTVTSF